MTASPWPPPEQIAAHPRPPPRRRNSSTSEPRIRAPETPMGWPRATAPPLTLTLSSSISSTLIEFKVTDANASLISHRSMSSALRPALSSAILAALLGVRAQGPAVEVRAGELELGRHLAGLLCHVLAAERVGEAIVDHRVDRLGVAHAEAEAGLLEQVRSLRHRLHAAPDRDLQVAGPDR